VELLIGDTVADAATLAPRATAATLGEEAVSFGALDAEANQVAHTLDGLGVRRGDLVAWWTGSSLRSLSAMVACARLGAVFAPISPQLEAAEAAAVLDYMDPRLVVTDRSRRDAAHDTSLVSGYARYGSRNHSRPLVVDALHELARTASRAPVTGEVRDSDPHILYLTSGSTGRPKGVLVSHRATWLRSAPGSGTFAGGIRGDGGVLSSFPLYHYGGWHYVIEAWLHRTAVHLVHRADAEHLLAAVARHRPTAMYCIPAVWERVLAAPGDLGCLRHADTGTSRIADDLVERLRRRAPNATTTVLYGSSEAGPMAALRHWQLDVKRGSVGRPISPGVLRIAADGEILFRGPTLMSSYLRLPAETAAAVRDGWYHSGDLGVRDDDGFVHITGRKREVIRSGGETVAPAEVEAALRGLPGIADVAVVGLPDERWGEVVCAVVVPEPGAPVPDVAALRAGLTGLASYKHPRRVVAAESIPRTSATGQVMRSAIREAVLREKAPA
jgi:fatty-acyl-CoA synthase